MSQNIISEWADSQKTQEALLSNVELNKLAHEFCKKFGVKVGYNALKDSVGVFTPTGLPAGRLDIRHAYNRKHEMENVYVFDSPIVNKQKGSARSSRDARDSTKITGLLRAIEKNNEEPTDQKLYKQYSGGLRFAFGRLEGDRHISRPSVEYHSTLSVFINCLNGSAHTNEQMTFMEDVVKQHNKMQKAWEDNKTLLKRFAGGCTIIGYDEREKFYLIGRARYEKDDAIVEQLQRHNTIEGTPHVGLAVMVKEYFRGRGSNFNSENAFGFSRHDCYHPNIDVSCGYAGNNIAWMLVPDEAPTV